MRVGSDHGQRRLLPSPWPPHLPGILPLPPHGLPPPTSPSGTRSCLFTLGKGNLTRWPGHLRLQHLPPMQAQKTSASRWTRCSSSAGRRLPQTTAGQFPSPWQRGEPPFLPSPHLRSQFPESGGPPGTLRRVQFGPDSRGVPAVVLPLTLGPCTSRWTALWRRRLSPSADGRSRSGRNPGTSQPSSSLPAATLTTAIHNGL